MKHLIPMTDFILELDRTYAANVDQFYRCLRYTNFLKQPKRVWMFLPVMSNGNIPTIDEVQTFANTPLQQEYEDAKERCLFDVNAFEYNNHGCKEIRLATEKHGDVLLFHWSENRWKRNVHLLTVEDLVKYTPKLTTSALKQLKL